MTNNCCGCTACCYAFPVVELDKGPFEQCEYATESGCSIYETRPVSCAKCECAYIQMPYGVPVELRPDRCGIVFERYKDSMVGTTVGPVSDMAKNQVMAFQMEGFAVVIRDDST